MAIEQMQKSYMAGESSWEPHRHSSCVSSFMGGRASKLVAALTCLWLVACINLRRNKQAR